MEPHKVKPELPLVRINLVSPVLNELDRRRNESKQVLARLCDPGVVPRGYYRIPVYVK